MAERELFTTNMIEPVQYTVATLPDAGENTGRIVLCTNGAAGEECLAYDNGSAWVFLALALLAPQPNG